MTIHILKKEKHFDFLAQNRIDPITGDLLKENDEIVICASCKSAFLVDSWEYIGRTHCEQTDSLKEIPVTQIVKFRRNLILNKKDEYYEIILTKKSYLTNIYFSSLSLFGFLIEVSLLLTSILKDYLGFGFLLGILCWVIERFLPYSGYSLSFEKDSFIFNKDKNNQTIIELENIDEIYYQKDSLTPKLGFLFLFFRKEKYYNLVIKTKDNEIYKFLIEKKDLEKVKTETNFLNSFNKNSLPSISVTKKIEQNRVN